MCDAITFYLFLQCQENVAVLNQLFYNVHNGMMLYLSGRGRDMLAHQPFVIMLSLPADSSSSSPSPPPTSSPEWLASAMVLDTLPVPGHPSNMANSRARAYCACSGCGWGLFGHFHSHLSFLSSFSLSLGDGPI